MFVGHFLAAFVLAASVAAWRGWPEERALAVGVVAGSFATLPDIDMLYAVVGLVGSLEGTFVTSDAFWDVANEIHRGATPFGDVFAGPSPALFYPLPIEAGLLNGTVLLNSEPTLHLFGAFFIELTLIWAGILVVARLRGWRIKRHINRRAAVGIAYAGAAFAIPAPTVETASPFVFSVLTVGFIGIPGRSSWREDRSTQLIEAVTTALAAVTLAAAAYAVTYLILLA